MADLLTQHLKNKSETHSALQSLFSQWDFDRKLIPKALQTVGNLFPHYSRHDESHSKQILVNIERLLGNNLSLLTATDTWLILEAAYWHDIGMVVPQRDLQEAMSDPEFDGFLQRFASNPHHELYSIALSLKVKPESFQIFFEGAPLDAVTRFRELMAEWFRSKHPTRAAHIVNDPHHSVGISSPRTELIPARLFSVLGRICKMHGASFDTLVGEDGLSFREAGMARDDCHPRFVACLLRLGDLLDLDDNRFCPVMQGIAGEDRPALSKAHEDKHAAIRHLRIDQERISIDAECKTVDGYLEAFRWFGWLKDEMQAQMSQWRDIVPSRELGLLPMLGPVSVQLGGNLKILNKGERPAFTLDAEKAIELLQGNNLYESEYACIRELLQNAVDATLLKIWMTNRTKLGDGSWQTPDEEAVQQLFAREEIHVSLTESEGKVSDTGKMSTWTLTIRDNGTGISLNDLQYMLKIGGSLRNTARRRQIDSMPEWMKPSGTFGIGFQSIFMLCDQVSLITKSLITNETLEVTMHSPTGAREGLVILKQLENDLSTPSGTTIKISFEREKFARSWSIPYRDDGSITYKLINSFDPNLDESFPYSIAKLADHVRVFGENSMVRIEGVLETQSGSYPLHQEEGELRTAQEANSWRFFRTSDAAVRLRYRPNIGDRSFGEFNTYYRGQKFEANNLYLPNVSIDIDLMSGSAGAWLNFNRDKISTAGKDRLKATVLECLDLAVREDIDTFKKGEPSLVVQEKWKPVTSFFLKSMAMSFAGKWADYSEFLGDAWLDIRWHRKGESLRNYFNKDVLTVGVQGPNNEPSWGNPDIEISENSDSKIAIFASEWMKRPNKFLQVHGNPKIFDTPAPLVENNDVQNLINEINSSNTFLHPMYKFTSDKVELHDEAAFACALARMMNRAFVNERVITHLDGKFSALSLSPETRIRARNLFPLIAHSNTPVLLPFLFRETQRDNGIFIEATAEQIEKLCKFIQPKLQNPADLKTIRALYNELIDWIDNQVMGKTVLSKKWFKARGLNQQ